MFIILNSFLNTLNPETSSKMKNGCCDAESNSTSQTCLSL